WLHGTACVDRPEAGAATAGVVTPEVAFGYSSPSTWQEPR
ncbi:MAG: hypothetical protein AVDCRST_MAG19-2408, partial [uncultured Thermomicrobiales bacterium]